LICSQRLNCFQNVQISKACLACHDIQFSVLCLILSKVIDTRFISAVSVHRATYCDVVVPHWAVLCGIIVMVVQAATFILQYHQQDCFSPGTPQEYESIVEGNKTGKLNPFNSILLLFSD